MVLGGGDGGEDFGFGEEEEMYCYFGGLGELFFVFVLG